jgi:hypothetical protein
MIELRGGVRILDWGADTEGVRHLLQRKNIMGADI